MDQFINIPVDHTGLIGDLRLASLVSEAMIAPFDFSDVFLYSHGWWTAATDAMSDYSRFSVEFVKALSTISPAAIASAPRSSFGIGVHWPSTLSDDAHNALNIFEPLSFYQMEKRSDVVGQNAVFALMQLMYQAREQIADTPMFRLTLIGHSFGCKVVCNALNRLYEEINSTGTPESYRSFVMNMRVNVVLLQACFECSALDARGSYSNLAKFPQLHILVTRSDLDLALKNLFPLAEYMNVLSLNPGSRQALGWAGPTDTTRSAFSSASMVIEPGYGPTADSLMPEGSRMLVADITPVHRVSNFPASPLKGHHSDIFLNEIYRLIAKFAFS